MDDIGELAESWEIHMTAARRSQRTIETYLHGLGNYLGWCERQGAEPDFSQRQVERWLAGIMNDGIKDTSARTWQTGVRMFAAWRAAELEQPNPLASLETISLDKRITDYITAAQLAALYDTCKTRSFTDLRDRALISVLFDTMARSFEVLAMTTGGTSIRERTARIELGKGRKGRVVAFSAVSARDIDRYKRARSRHKLASVRWLWLPAVATRSGRLTYDAMYASLRRRAARAEPPFRLHPHMFRAGGAIDFRRRGGQVTSLMTLGGWNDISMVQRYIRAAENEIAVEEAHRLFDERDGDG